MKGNGSGGRPWNCLLGRHPGDMVTYKRRIVLVTGRLDAALATRAAAVLLGLDASGDAPIELHVDSPRYPGSPPLRSSTRWA